MPSTAYERGQDQFLNFKSDTPRPINLSGYTPTAKEEFWQGFYAEQADWRDIVVYGVKS